MEAKEPLFYFLNSAFSSSKLKYSKLFFLPFVPEQRPSTSTFLGEVVGTLGAPVESLSDRPGYNRQVVRCPSLLESLLFSSVSGKLRPLKALQIELHLL